MFAVIAVAIALGWRLSARRVTVADLRFVVRPESVVAVDPDDTERWRYRFPTAYLTRLVTDNPVRAIGGDDPAIYVTSAFRVRQSDGLVEGGSLLWLDAAGRERRSFSFIDDVTFNGIKYSAPWVLTSVNVNEDSGHRRTAVAAHHYVWGESLVTVLDDRWQRRGTFVHAGWIELVRWLGPNRLLIGGFSDAHDGGMVALLDPAALDGQGPEPAGSKYHCENCASGAPIRTIIMPRSEVNRASIAPFNRVVVEMTPERVIARTIEVSSTGLEAANAIYEFTPSLELIYASFSARYWEIHQALEAQGKLNHTREQCPDKDGPREIQIWDPQTGWRTKKIR